MRLQKYMADAGIDSRRKCEELIKQGLVKVNGITAIIGTDIDPLTDVVEYQGKRVVPSEERVILAFNKPRNVICAAQDPEGRDTVMNYFRGYPVRLFHVGRLDYGSEGLLLMTNDGDFAYRMTHPKFELNKTYSVVCDGVLTREELQKLQKGILLDDGITAPALLQNRVTLANGNTAFTLTIHEGRNRQVRRMLEAVGHQTLSLRRIRIGPIDLGELKGGTWRELSEREHELLEEMLEQNNN